MSVRFTRGGAAAALLLASTACGDDDSRAADGGRDTGVARLDARADEGPVEGFDAAPDVLAPDSSFEAGRLDGALSDAATADAEVPCAADGDCGDGDPCTVDTCSAGRCVHVLVDADGDGFPALDVSGAACSAGLDCDDAQAIVHPGADEICDGFDENCDGVGDTNGRLTDDIRIAAGTNPAVVWAGDRYGLVWNGIGGLYFTTLSPAGEPIGAPVRVREADGNARARIVWTGTEFGILSADCRLAAGPGCVSGATVYLDRVETDGDHPTSTLLSTTGNWEHGLTWTGTGYGAVWVDFRDDRLGEIYFARVAADGATFGSGLRLTTNPEVSLAPSIAWSGSEYGVAWTDARDAGWEVYFTRVSGAGELVAGSDRRITNALGDSEVSALVWTGTVYTVAWTRADLDRRVFLASLDLTGEVLGGEVAVTPDGASRPALTRQGEGYGLAWTSGDGGGDSVFLTRLTVTGLRIGDHQLVAAAPGGSFSPSIAWTGAEFGVAWMDNRDGAGGTSIYFARFGVCGP